MVEATTSVEAPTSLANNSLTQLAADGDTEAAAQYLMANWEYLFRMANRVCGGVIDPDDLLAEAITALLARWRTGDGPTTGVNGYVVTSMRNRVIDELRSPRSKTSALEQVEDLAAPTAEGFRTAELHQEFALVRRAFDGLPSDQRDVLRATLLEGIKPRKLEERLGRPATAIYSLTRRSSLSLRRALLKEVLLEEAPPECALNAGRLPAVVPDHPDDAGHSPAMDHIRTCERCRTAWARFARIGSALGVGALLTLAHAVSSGTPASATAVVPPSTTDEDRQDARRRWALLVLAILALVAGVAMLLRDPGRNSASGTVTTSVAPATSLTATATPLPEGFSLEFTFVPDSPAWRIDELTVRLSPGMALKGVSSGWSCSPAGDVFTCRPSGGDIASGRLTFTMSSGTPGAKYDLRLSGVSGGRHVDLLAMGPVPPLPGASPRPS